MNINISLDTVSIEKAIHRINALKDDFKDGVADIVELLANDGAEVAQAAYGDWNVRTLVDKVSETRAEITVSGEMPLIAEFGAGQATMPVMFENDPGTPVYEGSYSELEGSQEYYKYGSWHFAGKYFTEVPARHGLLDAKMFIIENSTKIAQEVFEG